MSSSIAEDIKIITMYLQSESDTAKDILMHYGVPRRSGRYPWGSGEDPYQRGGNFLSRVSKMKSSGMTDVEIAKALNTTTTELRKMKSIARSDRRTIEVSMAKSLREETTSPTIIARKMSERLGKTYNESTIRSLLNQESEARMNKARETAEFLKKQIKEKGMIDVGVSVAKELGISETKMGEALKILQDEGYPVYKGGIPNVTNPGKQLNQKILCPKGTEHKEIYNYDKIHTITEYTSRDGGATFDTLHYPSSLSSKRVKVKFDEDGGTLKDGIVEIRPGVKDVSIGNQHYSQVRILVDKNKYIKGMAVYGDPKDFPKGVDVIVNSNKKKSVGKLGALKDIENDPDNPFGANIKANGQSFYNDSKGKYKDPITGKKQSLSKINKPREQGDWEDWKDKLPSQFLSKQSLFMANKQLNLAKANKNAEYEEIMSLPNATVKKNRLRAFAEDCDAAASSLHAAALPGQKYHVILPNNTLKDNECSCNRYANGTQLALIRYPHGGIFEIPILTVNNKNKESRRLIGTDSTDAICINHKKAAQLSGADFDGDTVMCIPTHDKRGRVKIAHSAPLKDLRGFEPKDEYAIPKGNPNKRPIMKKGSIQNEMGSISNLVTDMTIMGADNKEIAKAVKHSMVVIDAHKHKLDYKQSEANYDIKGLKKKYQGKSNAGAATIISRAGGQATVDKRQGTPKVNMKGKDWYDSSRPEGALIYKKSDKLYYPATKYDKKTGLTSISIEGERGKKISYNAKDPKQYAKYNPTPKKLKDGSIQYTSPDGKIKYKTNKQHQKSTKMAETDDARTLISSLNTDMEKTYANYANHMKALANKSRLQAEKVGRVPVNSEAKAKYKAQYDSLSTKLAKAYSNKPKERAAQRMANIEVKAKIDSNPELAKDNKKIKKLKQQALTKYRADLGAKSYKIYIDDKEWEAIQAHAIPETRLEKILVKADSDRLNELCMPKTKKTMTSAKLAKAKAMANSNYTIQEIAKALGVSVSTVSSALKGGK